MVAETFERHPSMPFGLEQEEFTDFALRQFQKRLTRLEHACGATLEEVYQAAARAIEQDDA